MNKDNLAKLNQLVRETGERIHSRLPSHESHPAGRIGIAHIYHVIKTLMGVPMKQCRNCRYQDIVDIIKFCEDNVDELHICTQLYDKYPPEPKRKTIDEFLH